VFAVLGGISFEVLGSPESLSASRRYDYAEHRVVEDRPRLQWVADGLETLELELMLHRSLTDPMVMLALLEAAAETHQALPLVFGNGDFRGYFVIVQIGTVSRQLSGVGDALAIVVRMTLRESPFTLDPSAPPLPAFVPIAVAAVAGAMATAASGSPAGVSPLLTLCPPFGPATAGLKPADVPTARIVRSI
jgi:phage protein U